MKITHVITLSLLLAGSIWAQVSTVDLRLEKEKLEADIRKIDRQVITTDSLTQLEAKRFEEKKLRQAEAFKQKQVELDTLAKQLKSLQVQIQSESFKQSSYKIKTENLSLRLQSLGQALAKKVEEFALVVESGIPWDLEERVARIRALKRDLELETASVEEGVSRLAGIVRAEIKFNDEIVLAERSIARNNGELVNVQMLRLGNLWMVYMDPSAKMYGRLMKQSTEQGVQYIWDEDLDFAQRKSIREAIEIKMAKRAPELILLPLSISLTQETK